MRDIKDYTEKYIDEPFEPTMVEIRRKTVIEQCNKYKHGNVLEIGCGTSPFFLDFKDYERMVIVEPGECFAENARELAKSESRTIDVIDGFFEEQVEVIKSMRIDFDYIILSSVLHELDDPDRMLRSIKAVCSSNTIVHINVPNAKSLHRLIAIEAGMIRDIHEQSAQMKKMQRRRTYDIDLLRQDVINNGFKVIDDGSYFIKPFTHLQMQRCLEERIIDENVLIGLEKVVEYMPDYGTEIYVNLKKG